jgi:acetolactate synthase I/III small subunit
LNTITWRRRNFVHHRAATLNKTIIMSSIILELRVRNHPGTMSHITGLFSRRAFNLEAIRCSPVGDGLESRMFLLVNKTPSLEQIEYYLLKLHDVLAIHQRCDLTETFFQIEDSASIAPVPAT